MDNLTNSIEATTGRVKVISLEIIVRMIENRPYYEVRYKKVGEDDYYIGYSSYDLKIVLDYIATCFEIVASKETNYDRIRTMSEEELAEFFVRHDLSLKDKAEEPNNWLEWLHSEAE